MRGVNPDVNGAVTDIRTETYRTATTTVNRIEARVVGYFVASGNRTCLPRMDTESSRSLAGTATVWELLFRVDLGAGAAMLAQRQSGSQAVSPRMSGSDP